MGQLLEAAVDKLKSEFLRVLRDRDKLRARVAELETELKSYQEQLADMHRARTQHVLTRWDGTLKKLATEEAREASDDLNVRKMRAAREEADSCPTCGGRGRVAVPGAPRSRPCPTCVPGAPKGGDR